MWSENKCVDVVTGKQTWYRPYAEKLCSDLLRLGIDAQILFSHEHCRNNSVRFYLSYPRIVPLTFVQNALISFVVHASALPKGKGFSPWVWQILEGSNVIPIVMFEMEEGLDTGKIFVKSQLQLTGYELLAEIRCMLAHEIEKLILTFLQDRDVLPPVPQQGDSTFYRRRTSADSELEINRSIREQFNLLRVVDNDNYPAFFTIDGHTYTLKIEKKND